jgi:hypothetical protein
MAVFACSCSGAGEGAQDGAQQGDASALSADASSGYDANLPQDASAGQDAASPLDASASHDASVAVDGSVGQDANAAQDASVGLDAAFLPDASGGADAGSGPDATVGQDASSPAACATGTKITSLPSCNTPDSLTIEVPKGCTPSVDGTLHDTEWSDATCIRLPKDSLVEQMDVYLKYSGDALYLASSTVPMLGMPYPTQFDPNGQAVLDGDEFIVNVYDDPFQTDGDRFDDVYSATKSDFVIGKAPAGIVTRCPGSTPNPVVYEWKLPFSALGITPGAAHAFGFAIIHSSGSHWPSTVDYAPSKMYSLDPSTWGQVSSADLWQ